MAPRVGNSRETLFALAGLLPDPVLVLDARDRLVFANESARESLSLGDADMDEDAALLIRSADFIERLRAIRRDPGMVRAESEVVLRRGPRTGDRVFGMRATTLPESAGFGPAALAVSLIDHTRLRHLERLRREFVANVSHDLRTPVTILKGYAQTLTEDFEVMDDSDRLRFLEKIRRNTDRLHGLLESMVELAAADDGTELSLKAGALNAVLRDTAEMMTDRLAARGLAIEVACDADDAFVEVDPMRFARITINVLENVMRYATGATRVRITTYADAEGFHVRIEDDGAGLPDAEYARIFDRFYRAEKSRAQTLGGSGIGLAIVKNLVLSHGGVVRAVPVVPKGFAVEITLPVAARPVPALVA